MKKWTLGQSVFLSGICVGLFTAAYVVIVAACPWVIKGYLALKTEQMGLVRERSLMASVYVCAVPIGIILWKLMRLIRNIGREQLFTADNISCLRWISWMCFAVAVIALVSALYYVMWIVIACCMAFMGLLIRVIKNVFERAREIKEENDFTI